LQWEKGFMYTWRDGATKSEYKAWPHSPVLENEMNLSAEVAIKLFIVVRGLSTYVPVAALNKSMGEKSGAL
jgi:hypothetical protein